MGAPNVLLKSRGNFFFLFPETYILFVCLFVFFNSKNKQQVLSKHGQEKAVLRRDVRSQTMSEPGWFRRLDASIYGLQILLSVYAVQKLLTNLVSVVHLVAQQAGSQAQRKGPGQSPGWGTSQCP